MHYTGKRVIRFLFCLLVSFYYPFISSLRASKACKALTTLKSDLDEQAKEVAVIGF